MVKMVHYDLEADILYIVTREGPVDDTILADDDVYIELDGNGDVVGIEIRGASANIVENPAKVISKRLREQIPITK